MGAHAWVSRICQQWELSSSRTWLSIVDASGCLRHPTSILHVAMQLLAVRFLTIFPCFLLSDDDPLYVPPKDSNDADDVSLGDNPTTLSDKHSKPTEDFPASEDRSDSSEDEFVGSITLSQSKRAKVENGHVTLQCTLAFCYLGLLWINEPVFVSDLLR